MAVVLNYTLLLNRGLFLVCENVQFKLYSSNKGCFQKQVFEIVVHHFLHHVSSFRSKLNSSILSSTFTPDHTTSSSMVSI